MNHKNIFFDIFLKQKLKLFIFIIFNILVAFITILLPMITGNFIDILTNKPTLEAVWRYCLIMIIMSFFNLLISYVVNRTTLSLKVNLTYDLHSKILYHIQDVPLKYVKENQVTYLNQRINNDSTNVINFGLSILSQSIINVITFVFTFIFIFRVNSVIGLSISGLNIIYIIMFIVLKKKLAVINLKLKEIAAKYYSVLQAQISKLKYMKVLGRKRMYKEQSLNIFNEFLSTSLKNQDFTFLFQSMENIIFMISQIILFSVGGLAIINNRMSIGTFIILTSFFTHLIKATKYFTNLGTMWVSCTVSLDRLIEYTKLPKEPNGKIQLTNVDTLTLESINFNFDRVKIFDNFNYFFEKGEIYVIQGDNGKGKSTLLDLIAGLQNGEFEGEIKYDSFALSELDREHNFKKIVSYCLQNSENIDSEEYGDLLFDFDNYKESLLNKLVSGFNMKHLLDKTNFKNAFSGGEVQKISLIRNLLKDTPILLLDEPTSALDAESKQFLYQHLDNISPEKIIIMVSHEREFNSFRNNVNILDL